MTIEVIPLRTQVPIGPLNIFVVYDDRLARIESETGLLVLRDPTDVRYYLELFAHFQHYAMRDSVAREFLLEIADGFRQEDGSRLVLARIRAVIFRGRLSAERCAA